MSAELDAIRERIRSGRTDRVLPRFELTDEPFIQMKSRAMAALASVEEDNVSPEFWQRIFRRLIEDVEDLQFVGDVA